MGERATIYVGNIQITTRRTEEYPAENVSRLSKIQAFLSRSNFSTVWEFSDFLEHEGMMIIPPDDNDPGFIFGRLIRSFFFFQNDKYLTGSYSE